MDERSHVQSLEGIYAASHRWEVGLKIVWKLSELHADLRSGDWFRTNTNLAVISNRYHVTKQWDGLGEYRWLRVHDADDERHGVLIGVDRHIGGNLRLGVGYNFTEFNDDLTNLSYDNQGWFSNITGKY